MDSKQLSQRARQPGHDKTFKKSEENFIVAALECLDEDEFLVINQPSDLSSLFVTPGDSRNLGVRPEAKIESRLTGRKFFVEVKKQGPHGNAEERAMKHHTVQFYKELNKLYGYDYHPFVTVFCESLSTLPRYTVKFEYLIEPENYFLWVDYSVDSLCRYLHERADAWLR